MCSNSGYLWVQVSRIIVCIHRVVMVVVLIGSVGKMSWRGDCWMLVMQVLRLRVSVVMIMMRVVRCGGGGGNSYIVVVTTGLMRFVTIMLTIVAIRHIIHGIAGRRAWC